jgi:hypothetical protein
MEADFRPEGVRSIEPGHARPALNDYLPDSLYSHHRSDCTGLPILTLCRAENLRSVHNCSVVEKLPGRIRTYRLVLTESAGIIVDRSYRQKLWNGDEKVAYLSR